MESKTALVDIGLEGFALLDEYYTPKGRQSAYPPKLPTPKTSLASQDTQIRTCHYQYQPQKPNVYQINPVSRPETMAVQNHEAKRDLVKIGLEGFALLDEYYGKKPGPSYVAPQKPPISSRRPAVRGPAARPKETWNYYQPEKKPRSYQVKPVYGTEERVMDAYEVVKLHGGVLIIDRYN